MQVEVIVNWGSK